MSIATKYSQRILAIVVALVWCGVQQSFAATPYYIYSAADSTEAVVKDPKKEQARLDKEMREQERQRSKEQLEEAKRKLKEEKERQKQIMQEEQQKAKAEKEQHKQLMDTLKAHRRDSLAAERMIAAEQRKLEKEQRKQDEEERLSELKKSRATIDSLLGTTQRLSHWQKDSIQRAARLIGMSNKRLKLWTENLSDWQHDPELRRLTDDIDTVRHDTLAALKSGIKAERNNKLYGYKVMAEKHFQLYDRINQNMLRSMQAYADIDAYNKQRGRIAFHFDSLKLESKRKPGQLIFNKLLTRQKLREKRIWNEVDQMARSGQDLTDIKAIDILWQKDSVLQIYRDSLGAKNLFRRFSFHTNGLAWLLGVPNLGIEFDLSRNPSTNTSVLLKGYFKPNLNFDRWHHNTRFAYYVRSVVGEVRKYWRSDKFDDTNDLRTWSEFYEEIVPIQADSVEYLSDPITLEGKHFAKYRKVKTAAGNEPAADGEKGKAKTQATRELQYNKDTTIVTNVYSRNWLTRKWQRLRYNTLSHRFPKKSHVHRAFYVGLTAGYEKYFYVLGSSGKQGKRAYGGISAGVVFEDLIEFRNGTAVNLEIGGALCAQMETFSKFTYDKQYDDYHLAEVQSKHITPYPVVRDLHVSLVYTLTPTRNKVNNLMLADRFMQKMDRVHYKNKRKANIAAREYEKKKHLQSRKEFDKYDHDRMLENREKQKELEELRRKYKEEGRDYDAELAEAQKAERRKTVINQKQPEGGIGRISFAQPDEDF